MITNNRKERTMITEQFYTYQALSGRKKGGVVIEIGPEEFPELKTLEDGLKVHSEQGTRLAHVLRDNLAGGTFDQLVAELLLIIRAAVKDE